MCGRFSLASDPEALLAEFGIGELPEGYVPRYNIAPSQPVLALIATREGAPRVGFLRWGLLPHWSPDPAGRRFINARAESLETRSVFHQPFLWGRRCLLLADGFYEWRRDEHGKAPMRIRLPGDRPFTMAGIWDRWNQGDGPPAYSCAIITVPASRWLSAIHDRMPAILPAHARATWLDRAAEPAAAAALLRPSEDPALEAYEVSTLVNSPENDVPACFAPVQAFG